MDFDPYHKWLAIPKDQRPPTHYQLLGVAPGEKDVDVIDEAALRQMAHVRAYQIGPHAAESQRVLNEISEARTVLLNADKRKAYDELLAKKHTNGIAKGPPPLPGGPATLPKVELAGKPSAGPASGTKLGQAPPPAKTDTTDVLVKKAFPVAMVAIGGGILVALVLLIGVGALIAWKMSSKPPDPPPVVQVDGKPADGKPADGKPADGKPADGRPAQDRTPGNQDGNPIIVVPKNDKTKLKKDKDKAGENTKEAVPVQVEFPKNGRYISEVPLAADDAREPSSPTWGVYRPYLVPMEAGVTYSFTLGQGTPFVHPKLIVFDPQGKKKFLFRQENGVVKDEYKATQTGVHRVHAVLPVEIAATFQFTIQGPAEVAMPTEVAPKTYDLLSIIDLNLDVVDGKGKWKLEDKTLVCTEGNFVPRVQIPYMPPDEYDFIVTFSQPKLRNGISMMMPKPGGGGMFYWSCGHQNGDGAGFGNVTGFHTDQKLSGKRKGLVQPNRETTTTVQVRKSSVKALVNGEALLSFNTDYSNMALDTWRKMKNERILGVSADDPATITRIHIVEITGKGKPVR